MTSYGGATSVLRSPARERRYRMPGKALTSAIGRSPELHVPEVGHAGHLTEPRQHVGADGIVDGEDHHGVAARRVAPDLHARDVDVVLTKIVPKLPTTPGRSSCRLTRKRPSGTRSTRNESIRTARGSPMSTVPASSCPCIRRVTRLA